ncbi:MAG: hypothetical protein BWY85_00770 [Firmicutes bacterium ADurb.Bin506]|jgi:hypothetical protein|nr:MAG: hypothetical protein BWY85_00770 [Firmicutes bacterium ADurb.Bin506]
MYRSARFSRIRGMVLLVVAMALAVALPLGVGAESSVELRGQVMSTVRITVSKARIDWLDLEPGSNDMPGAFTVNAAANVGFHLSIHGSNSCMVNGSKTLANPLQYRIDDGLTYSDLTTSPVRIGTYSSEGAISVDHTVHLKQVIEFADAPITVPGECYTTTILFTAEQIVP